MTQQMTATRSRNAPSIDAGLRAYMLMVYNYMVSGLALTGVVAYAVSTSPAAIQLIVETPLFWVVVLAPIGVVLTLMGVIGKAKAGTARALFWLYSALVGLSLFTVFIEYTDTSIARVFFITASIFAAMSLYGYATKRDLSSFGSFLLMGLIGVLVAMVVNILLQSAAMHFVTSVVGVLVFVGFTAYDTQAIKDIYLETDDEEARGKKAVFGALMLYLDFAKLFVRLLELFGESDG